jgi:soluble P-type ATPase
MPSTSPKQAAFMRAIAHNQEFAQKVGVPQSVGKEFSDADKRKALVNELKKPYKPATGGVRG